MENYSIPSLLGKARVRAELEMWEQISSLSPWIVSRWHGFKSRSLLNHTYAHIPYYRQWIEKQKAHFPQGEKHLSILPIMDKQLMLYNGILNFTDPQRRNFPILF